MSVTNTSDLLLAGWHQFWNGVTTSWIHMNDNGQPRTFHQAKKITNANGIDEYGYMKAATTAKEA